MSDDEITKQHIANLRTVIPVLHEVANFCFHQEWHKPAGDVMAAIDSLNRAAECLEAIIGVEPSTDWIEALDLETLNDT